MTHYVIIGDGGAGTTAAFYIRQADPAARIEMFSDDPNPAYYRAALTNYLIGELRESQLFATPPDFYEAYNVKRSLGRVVAVDGKKSEFTLAQGDHVSYDQLLIAAGASPNAPSFTRSDMPGVMTMRTLQDARTVMDLISAKQLRQAIVVGGGPLGIEWVQGLLHHNVRVTYLLRGDVFFGNALDRTASDLVISRLRAEGVDVRLNEEIGEAIAGKDGRLRAIKLKNSGNEVECQLVGAAIGIHPNVEFLDGSGIDVAVDEKRKTPLGIKVDESMRTNIPNVYAAGDIIHRTLGLWEPARLQGRVAGRNMAGGAEKFRRRVHYNATRLYDLDFAGVGELAEQPSDQVMIDFPRGSGRVSYRKFIVREGKLVGVIMLGQRKERVRKYGMHYQELIEKKTDVSSISKNLVDPGFDLASWIDSQQIGEQIDSVRQIHEQAKAPSIADMRQTRHELGPDALSAPKQNPAPTNAMLIVAGARTPIGNVTRIGRRSQNDVVIDDPDVSGQHAQIRWDGNAFLLEDVQSRNGTFLNDVKVSAPTRLASGAVITVGQSRIQFVIGTPVENLRMTSAGLPEAQLVPSAAAADPVWGILQVGEKQIPLQMLSLNIGRDAQADVVLDDPSISYLHAQLVRQGNESYLRDLGSRNGTYVNETLISVPHHLASGDVIKLGGISLSFRAASAPAPIKEIPNETPAPSVSRTAQQVASPAEKPTIANARLDLELVARAGPLSGRAFPLNRSPLTIGRDPASTIAINDQTASWHHAVLIEVELQWFVTDLGSSNHTFLNGAALEPNHEHPLHAKDEIKIGDTLLEVRQNAG